MGAAVNARWLVAKYVGDLRRQETRNVGVVLLTPEMCLSRFLGERADGSLDGRRLRWAGSSRTFKAWVAYWRHRLDEDAVLGGLVERRADDSYFLVPGGERLLGEGTLDPRSFLDYLFSSLVEEEPERAAPSVIELAETVFSRLGIRDVVQQGFRIEVPDGDRAIFDYRYDNGVVSLMHRAGLVYDDSRSWDVAHSVAWAFRTVRDSGLPGTAERPQLISLVRGRPADDELDRQLGLLRGLSEVVNLEREDEASEQLGELLHVGLGPSYPRSSLPFPQ